MLIKYKKDLKKNILHQYICSCVRHISMAPLRHYGYPSTITILQEYKYIKTVHSMDTSGSFHLLFEYVIRNKNEQRIVPTLWKTF